MFETPRRFKPFPEVPRYPEEDAILEGAPTSAQDSILLSVPELAHSAQVATTFKELNSAGRARLAERYVHEAVTNPRALIEFFDALHILEESGAYPLASSLRQTIETHIDKLSTKEIPTAAVMEQWLTLYTESATYKPLAEKILRRLVERCKTPREITTLLYRLAEGGFESSNSEVIKHTLHILGYETPILTPQSPQARQYFLAMFDLDDAVLKDAMEIDGAFFYIAYSYEPDLLSRISSAQDIIQQQREFDVEMDQIASTNRGRFVKLLEHYNRETSGGRVADLEGVNPNEFPLKLLMDDIGPLRRVLNEFMAVRMADAATGNFAANLDLPGYSGVRGADSLVGLGTIVRDYLNRRRDEVLVMDKASYVQSLSYVLPPSMEHFTNYDRISNANSELRREMTENSLYLLSPRGDRVSINDQLLGEIGYHEIMFQMDPRNKRQTIVTLAVGNKCEFTVLLDEHFALREARSQRGILLPAHGAFLEHIILSHLREIRCSERVNETGGHTPETPHDRRRAFTSRRPHRRILPEGQSPTSVQIARILAEYDVDLVRMNRERAALGESRKATYVFEVEHISVPGTGPVRSQTPEATKRLHAIIKG